MGAEEDDDATSWKSQCVVRLLVYEAAVTEPRWQMSGFRMSPTVVVSAMPRTLRDWCSRPGDSFTFIASAAAGGVDVPLLPRSFHLVPEDDHGVATEHQWYVLVLDAHGGRRLPGPCVRGATPADTSPQHWDHLWLVGYRSASSRGGVAHTAGQLARNSAPNRHTCSAPAGFEGAPLCVASSLWPMKSRVELPVVLVGLHVGCCPNGVYNRFAPGAWVETCAFGPHGAPGPSQLRACVIL